MAGGDGGVGRRGRRGRLSRSADFDRVYREGRSHATRDAARTVVFQDARGWAGLIMAKTSVVVEVSRLHATHGGLRLLP